MMTLDAILDEASSFISIDNVTILSDEQFHHVRAPSSSQFKARLERALFSQDDLLEAERQNLAEGLEVIEPVRGGIHGGYWYLRNVSGHGEIFPAGESHYDSVVEALEAAIEWWNAEAWCRGVVVHKFHCKHSNGKI